MSTPIKFGTDGWRAIIAQEFTTENVARVSDALAQWLNGRNEKSSVVIGHDCRFGGEMFAAVAAKQLCAQGIRVLLAKGFVSTPMVSLGVLQHGADQGVVITASHNPPSYNGYKLKGAHGGPSSPADIAAVEGLIQDRAVLSTKSLAEFEAEGLLNYLDLEAEYIQYLEGKFDFEKMRSANFRMAYDAMYGAGQNVIRKLLPDSILLHCEENPSFMGTAPEPLNKNLRLLSETVTGSEEIKLGLATDGDADRIGLYDEHGNFVDAHHIILLLVHYLHKYKGMDGKVAIAFSTTDRVKKMAEAYGLPVEVTPIGFKHISEIMVREDVLVGGEESGGIAVKGHIPERDGIYDGLVIYEFMQATGKSLSELCEEVYGVVGRFVYSRADLHLDNALKEHIIQSAHRGHYKSFGRFAAERTETTDGVKYHFPGGGWAMLRASGTEPLLRIYAEGGNAEETAEMLKTIQETVLG